VVGDNMPNIQLSQLSTYLMPIIKDCLYEVAEKANDRLRYHMDEEVYIGRNNYYANGTGQPTYELRESITTGDVTSSGNTAQVEVFHDKNKMQFSPDDFIHGSRYWKNGVTDIRDILPQIINDGLSGDLFGEGWWQEPRPYFSDTLIELQQQGLIKKWFIEALKKRGISAY
jgi:hypothetical protein